MKLRRVLGIFTLMVCAGLFCVWRTSAQEGMPTILVKSKQVLVPVFWGGTLECKGTKNKNLLKCTWDGAVNDHVSRKDWLAGERIDPEDLGFVSLDSFHIFEDGKEQKIENIERMGRARAIVTDNLGSHVETAIIPTGIWSTSDEPQSATKSHFRLMDVDDFQIAYSPPDSPAGSCHRIEIKGPHASKIVYRDQYCNVDHSATDTLLGTPEGAELQKYIAEGKPGKIGPAVQANYFYNGTGWANVDLTISFPISGIGISTGNGDMVPYSLLISALGPNGKMIARQSQGYTQNPSYKSSGRPD